MRLLRRLLDGRIGQLIRFYQAAAINTAFGYGTYALLVFAGANLYVAQIVAQVLGVTFNYFVYSRHVFRDRQGSKASFVLAEGVADKVKDASAEMLDKHPLYPGLDLA